MFALDSLKSWILSFLVLVGLIAVLFWVYLNIQASLMVSAHKTDIQLPKSLATRIHVNNQVHSHPVGQLNTQLLIDRQMNLPLKGKYLADLKFVVETPITVNVDYSTKIAVNEVMPVETTTDLIYKSRFLPKFPLKLDIPVNLEIPFELKRSYTIPVTIYFDGPVYFEFDEQLHLPIQHKFDLSFPVDDQLQMSIAPFDATLINSVRETQANLDMKMQIPLSNIRP